MGKRASAELEGIINELRAVIRELEAVGIEINMMKGIGAEHCSSKLHGLSEKYERMTRSLYRLR